MWLTATVLYFEDRIPWRFFFPSKWCKIAPKYHIPNHLSRTFIRLNSFSHNLSFIDHKFTIMWTPLSLLQFKHVSTTYFIFRSQEFLIHSASPKQVYVDQRIRNSRLGEMHIVLKIKYSFIESLCSIRTILFTNIL